ncbi:outer membrane protein [Yoonia sp.]|uniref:outer membrane protein n=1 Tax=Yoonia sp. TaxID=2212373 RepID=UPI003919D97A
MRLKFIAAATAAFGAFTMTAQAGSLAPAVEQPPVAMMPAQPVMPARAGDWTGAYAGLSIGGSDIDAAVKGAGENGSDLALTGDGGSTGLFAGYNYQLGNIVVGVEFDFDATNYRVGEDEVGPENTVVVEATSRLKGRVGVPLGNGLAYGVAGIVGASTNSVIPALGNFAVEDGVGYLLGAGYDMRIGDNLLAGGEVLYHEFDDDNLNVEVTTFRLRVGYRF